MGAAAQGVLLDEGESDLGLARSHSVGVDHSMVRFDDLKSPMKAVLLKAGQIHGIGYRTFVVVVFRAQQLQQCQEVDLTGAQ